MTEAIATIIAIIPVISVALVILNIVLIISPLIIIHHLKKIEKLLLRLVNLSRIDQENKNRQ